MESVRIGIFVESQHVYAWQAASIVALCQIPGAQLVTTILYQCGNAQRGRVAPRPSKLVGWYLRRDSAKHALPRLRDPLLLESLEDVARRASAAPTHVQAKDRQVVARLLVDSAIDLVLDLTTATPLRDLAGMPRLGIWRHDWQDRNEHSTSPFGLVEVFRDEPTIATILYRIGSTADDDLTLYRSVGATNRYSVRKTLNEQLWKVANFAPRTLKRILAGTEPAYERLRKTASTTRLSDAVMSVFLLRMLLRRLAVRVTQALFIEQWFIAYRLESKTASQHEQAVDPVVSVFTESALDFTTLIPPKDRVWADPFPYVHEGKQYLFYEEVRLADRKGRIVVSEITADGAVSEPRSVLERPYHLSYPFVFAWQGTTWMIPESGANRTVELYRAERFPEAWVLDRILLDDVAACDATIFERDGRWWMFVTIAPDPSEAFWDELHLYSAQSPLGPWVAHVNNPVRSDVRDSRPAGRVVDTARGLLRPSQDCSRGYGYAIVLNRVDTIDDLNYTESEIGRLSPDWHDDLTGTHTINHCGCLVAIDGKVRRPRYWR